MQANSPQTRLNHLLTIRLSLSRAVKLIVQLMCLFQMDVCQLISMGLVEFSQLAQGLLSLVSSAFPVCSHILFVLVCVQYVCMCVCACVCLCDCVQCVYVCVLHVCGLCACRCGVYVRACVCVHLTPLYVCESVCLSVPSCLRGRQAALSARRCKPSPSPFKNHARHLKPNAL